MLDGAREVNANVLGRVCKTAITAEQTATVGPWVVKKVIEMTGTDSE